MRGQDTAEGLWFCCSGCAAMALQLQNLANENQQLRMMLSRDPVTGLPPRALMADLWGTVSVQGIPAVLFVDIDHFKAINDRWGHLAGDAVLGTVAQRIVGALRHQDACVRYGGEEFMCFLAATDRFQTTAIAERIRQAVSRHPISGGSWSVRITVSIGVAIAELKAASLIPLLESADHALYQAKTRGRNQVVMHTDPPLGGVHSP